MDLQELLLVSLLVLSSSCFSCDSIKDGTSIFKPPGEAISHDMSSRYAPLGMVNVKDGSPHIPRGSMLEGLSKMVSFKTSERVVNVDDYGAKGDGSDATEAFTEAWKETCSSPSAAVLLVPQKKKYLLKPIIFSGPCKSNVTVKIKGTLEASSDRSEWKINNARHWILFRGITNLVVEGGGTLNGNGQIWWQHSCKVNKAQPCTDAPTALFFYECYKLKVGNLKLKDSQQIHTVFEKCINVQASNLNIIAPATSPNTDGIHVSGTTNMKITDCFIRTGDDCISIVSGSRSIAVSNIVCGPGHGISIGSLGAKNSVAQVADVLVDGAALYGTTNGVRIKTWQGGHGYAKDIIFQNITMHNVQNPIIIDQNYCDSKYPCHEQNSAVQISRVFYRNIRGTSASEVAMTFDCSRSSPCRQISMQDINLTGEDGKTTKSLCKNIKWTQKGKVTPFPSLPPSSLNIKVNTHWIRIKDIQRRDKL